VRAAASPDSPLRASVLRPLAARQQTKNTYLCFDFPFSDYVAPVLRYFTLVCILNGGKTNMAIQMRIWAHRLLDYTTRLKPSSEGRSFKPKIFDKFLHKKVKLFYKESSN
jgi:hypothetical protein